MATSELVHLKVKVSKDLRRKLKMLAADTGKSMNELVNDAITALVQRKGAK